MASKFWLIVWCTLVGWFPLLANGYLNVFISHREVIKLMGLEADLFYVHEGAVNTYAMHFTVPVPADVHDLEFSWQSLTTYPLPYTITIDYEHDQTALAAPTLSIPDKGYVPQQIETFLVHLPCTGHGNNEVPLVVNMLVSGPPRTNDTKLHFKRNKICLKGLFPAPNQSAAPAQAPSPGHALLGAAACALGLVLVVGLIASAMYLRARKQIRQDSLHTSFTTAGYGSHQNVFIRLDPVGRPPSANSGSYATIASLNKYPLESKKSCNIFDRFRSSTPTPSPYATALLPMGNDHIADTIYSKPESICPSRISYYASSQLTQKKGCNASELSYVYRPGLDKQQLPQQQHQQTQQSVAKAIVQTAALNCTTNHSLPTPAAYNWDLGHLELSTFSKVNHSGRCQTDIGQVYSMSTPKSSRGGGNGSVFGGASSSAGSGSDPKEKLRRIPNVQPGTLMCQHLVKEGTYGRIYAGNLGDSCDIIIKTVVDGASLTQVACLLQEASTLIGVCHPNILTPLLANTELPGPPEIAYAYPSKGNLKIFLQKSRELNSPLSTRQLVEFGLHVTKGLAHLHSLGIIHRDIATRNCYLDMDSYVKICDSALSRDLFPDDYHCLCDNENRPLKWMALESLQKKYFNTYSDIWTLGVLFWELATLALTPFEEVDIFELSAYLSDGFRLGQPINCPDEFFTVMSCCWLEDPKQRPSFPQLLAYLQDFHEDLGKYI